MKTQLQIAISRSTSLLSPIPPMTDPLGRSWDQPDRRLIEIDDTHALMSRKVFDELKEYSASNPSGVYPGKMWKRHDGVFIKAGIARGEIHPSHDREPVWLLAWYGFSPKGPEYCTVNFRTLLIEEDGGAQ